MPTFTDIGLDFPLFQGLVEDAILEEPGVCSRCAATAPLLLAKKCYDCFRASGHTMNTEYGMVRPEDARAGVTHGVPLDPKRLPDLPLVAHPIDPAFPDEHWYSVKCDPQDLEELTRTPKYHTWQGEQWLFCCGRPAVFAGTLNSRSLAKFAPRIGTSPQDILDGLVSQLGIRLPISLQDLDGGSVGVYVFRCRECQGLLSHVDCD